MAEQMELVHLRREVKTALELAIIALAPTELIDGLGVAAGLLEAILGLPSDSTPAIALGPKVVARAQKTLTEWRKWQKDHPAKASA